MHTFLNPFVILMLSIESFFFTEYAFIQFSKLKGVSLPRGLNLSYFLKQTGLLPHQDNTSLIRRGRIIMKLSNRKTQDLKQIKRKNYKFLTHDCKFCATAERHTRVVHSDKVMYHNLREGMHWSWFTISRSLGNSFCIWNSKHHSISV